jgi:hypothetical protein
MWVYYNLVTVNDNGRCAMDNVTATATAQAATTITGNIIWLYALIVALLVLIPHLVDIFKAYKSREALIKKLADQGVPVAEIKELIKEAVKSPSGITGLTRGAIALTVIAILGIALFHLIITRTTEDSQVIGNVLSMVSSLIAAIVGFYFGGRTKEKAAEEATEELADKVIKKLKP